jgi:hypothetical protein
MVRRSHTSCRGSTTGIARRAGRPRSPNQSVFRLGLRTRHRVLDGQGRPSPGRPRGPRRTGRGLSRRLADGDWSRGPGPTLGRESNDPTTGGRCGLTEAEALAGRRRPTVGIAGHGAVRIIAATRTVVRSGRRKTAAWRRQPPISPGHRRAIRAERKRKPAAWRRQPPISGRPRGWGGEKLPPGAASRRFRGDRTPDSAGPVSARARTTGSPGGSPPLDDPPGLR